MTTHSPGRACVPLIPLQDVIPVQIEATLGVAETLFVGCVDIWVEKAGWKIADKRYAARLFCGLLRMQIFEVTLFGMATPTADETASSVSGTQPG